MKKIILAVCFLFMVVAPAVFADEIIDCKGVVIPCKIETISEGFVEYHKDGNLYRFVRGDDSPVFNDYVDVKQKLFKKDSTSRYFGKIIVKDMWGIIIRNENGKIDVPWYRVKSIGVYKP